jgi:hypothetical protein
MNWLKGFVFALFICSAVVGCGKQESAGQPKVQQQGPAKMLEKADKPTATPTAQ